MSVEEIVRYVRQTPGNTNPSVVGSMVNAEMNSTLKAAKEYTDSQRIAHTETKVITWDGNTEGKYIISGEINLVLVSDIPFDTHKETVKRAIAVDGDNQSIYDTFIKDVIPNDDGTVTTIYMVEIGGGTIPMIVSQDKDTIDTDGSIMKKGVYSLFFEDNYISLIETETIHQIDQKFIPKTVVDFDELFPGVDWMEATTLAIQKGGQHVIYGNYVDTVLRQITIEPGETMLATFTVNTSKSTAPASYMMYEGKPYNICFSFMGHITSGSNQFPASVVSARVMISHYFIVIFAEIAAQIPAET